MLQLSIGCCVVACLQAGPVLLKLLRQQCLHPLDVVLLQRKGYKTDRQTQCEWAMSATQSDVRWGFFGGYAQWLKAVIYRGRLNKVSMLVYYS